MWLDLKKPIILGVYRELLVKFPMPFQGFRQRVEKNLKKSDEMG